MSFSIPKGDAADFQSFVDAFFAELQSSGVATGGELSALTAKIAGYRNDLNAMNIRFDILTTKKAETLTKKQAYIDSRIGCSRRLSWIIATIKTTKTLTANR